MPHEVPSHSFLEFPGSRIFCDYGNVLCLCAISHVWLLSTWNVANLTEGLNLKLEVNYG